MFVSSLSVGWLKCTFHCNISYVIIFSLRTAKVGIFFIVPKIFAKLSRFKWCFILIIRMFSDNKVNISPYISSSRYEKKSSNICFTEIDD